MLKAHNKQLSTFIALNYNAFIISLGFIANQNRQFFFKLWVFIKLSIISLIINYPLLLSHITYN